MLRAGVNPQGVQVVAFGKPSTEELEPFLRRACDEPATSTGRRPFSRAHAGTSARRAAFFFIPGHARLDSTDTTPGVRSAKSTIDSASSCESVRPSSTTLPSLTVMVTLEYPSQK